MIVFSRKEHFDKKTIDSAFRKITENEAKELKTHFVYVGRYYWIYENRLRSFILEGMKKLKMNSVMVTSIYIRKWKIITKEKMEKYCKGEDREREDSVNDDLESFFEDLRLGKEPDDEVWTYFLPKLTEEELELVERKDASYLHAFFEDDPDVEEAEMKLSESDSKFVQGVGRRRTITIENSSEQNISNGCHLQK